jgi:hypothetical protein
VPGIQSGKQPTCRGCQWWVSVHTSSAKQFARALRGSSLLGLFLSWCPRTQLTLEAIGRLVS